MFLCLHFLFDIKMFRAKFKYVQCYCNVLRRYNSTDKDIPISFFMKAFDLPYERTYKIIQKFPELHRSTLEDVESTYRKLLKFKFTPACIRERPKILTKSSLSLENRYKALQECGITDIKINTLLKYTSLLNRSVDCLKYIKIIPPDTNVVETLVKSITDMELNPQDISADCITPSLIKMRLLEIYLEKKIGMNESDIARMWKLYRRIKNRSFSSIIRTIDLLKNELNFTNEKIIKNIFCLHADPENILRLINEIKKIGDMDIREALRARPKIVMVSCESVAKIIDSIRKSGISDNSPSLCLDVFTLSPATIDKRLSEWKEIKEFTVLTSHPRVLRLIYYHNKATLRLEYLKKIKVKCASLHVITGNSSPFKNYARGEIDIFRGTDVYKLLMAKLNISTLNEVRLKMIRHSNWTHVPIANILSCLDFLESKDFTSESIFQNVHILLYPLKQIESQLVKLKTETFDDFDAQSLTQSQTLGLCLYFIELEYHFTGDGIWSETEPVHDTDQFTTVLPEMPI